MKVYSGQRYSTENEFLRRSPGTSCCKKTPRKKIAKLAEDKNFGKGLDEQICKKFKKSKILKQHEINFLRDLKKLKLKF